MRRTGSSCTPLKRDLVKSDWVSTTVYTVLIDVCSHLDPLGHLIVFLGEVHTQ
jgi:hypothetical protein